MQQTNTRPLGIPAAWSRPPFVKLALFASFLCAALPLGCDDAQAPDTEAPPAKPGSTPAEVASKDEAPSNKAAEANAAAKPEAKQPAEFPALPADATVLDVLGGTLKVPKGAKLGVSINSWWSITAADDFTMVARQSHDTLSDLKQGLGDVKIIVEDTSTVVYEKQGGFGFIAIAGPEPSDAGDGDEGWLIECREGSAKEWAIDHKAQGHPRERIDQMVSVCRSFSVE